MTTAATGTTVLELRDVSKSFGPVVALRSGSLTVEAGSIHALVGENGAGKSTLVKVVAGVYRRDGGDFLLGGESVDFASTAESKDAGIAVIYQEPTLFPDLSVTENIFMGRMPLGARRRIDKAAMHAEATALFQRLGVHIDPRRPALGLSIADQQIIEIAKAISLDARLLVMDEPTAALSGNEVARLFAVARSLRDEGRALVFISHRFDEVFDLCDTVTVMRDGSYISTDTSRRPPSRRSSPRWSAARSATCSPRRRPRSATSSSTSRASRPRASSTASPSRSGPARSWGSPASSAPAAARSPARSSASTRTTPASVTLAGKPVPAHDPRAAIRAGIAFVPEDRRQQGLVIQGSVGKNIASVIRSRISKAGFVTAGSEYAAARPWAERLEVKTNALDMKAATMSGGNQQKVVIAKWLADQPQAADHRRAHPRHRRRHQGRGAPPALRARRPGHGDPDDLQRAARGARHGRPRARRPRRPDHRGHRPRRRHARERDGCRHPIVREGVVSTDLLVEPSRQSAGQRALSTLLRSRELSIAIVLVLIVVAATAKRHTFVFSHDGWRDTLLTPSILLLLAVGQMVVIVTRNVDLSVGSMLGITAYVTGKIFIANPDIPVRAGLRGRSARRCRARSAQRLPRGVLPGAGARRDARHHVRLPRLPHPQIGNGRIVAGDIPANFEKLGTQQMLDDPGAHAHRPGGAGRRRLLPADRPRRSRALRDRVGPRRRPPLRPERRQAGLRRLRAERRAGRPRRACSPWPATPRPSPAPAATSSSRPSPPW